MENNNTQEMVDIKDFLNDPRLVEKINGKIMAYKCRPVPGKGLRWKRGPEDELISAGNFNALYMIDQFLRNVAKTSTLSARVRNMINVYVVTSMQQIYEEDKKKATVENQKEENNGNQEESRG